MPQAERSGALDLWHPEAKAAWREFSGRMSPAFKRMIQAQNTPREIQARFEYNAILKVARELYHERLLMDALP
jgi:hypothetical protein